MVSWRHHKNENPFYLTPDYSLLDSYNAQSWCRPPHTASIRRHFQVNTSYSGRALGIWDWCGLYAKNVSIGTYTGHFEKFRYIFETPATPLASSLILLLDPPHRASKLLTLVLPTYIKVAYLSKEVVVLIFLM